MTYHKHPGPDWPAEEFQLGTAKLAHGNQEQLKLAERRTVLSNGLEIREVRSLEDNGHQTSVLATTDTLSREAIAAGMFARWSQEKFLKARHEGRLSNCLI